MSEKWLPITGYEGLYSVSDHGRIRSEPRKIKHPSGRLRNWQGRILSTPCEGITGKGRKYPSATLWKDGHSTKFRVHDLVTKMFIGPKPAGLEVLHSDDNPLNNHISNLRYGTHLENGLDIRRNNLTCNAGHRWTPANTYIRRGTSRRQCLACMKIQNDKRPRKTAARRNRKTTLPQHNVVEARTHLAHPMLRK